MATFVREVFHSCGCILSVIVDSSICKKKKIK